MIIIPGLLMSVTGCFSDQSMPEEPFELRVLYWDAGMFFDRYGEMLRRTACTESQ